MQFKRRATAFKEDDDDACSIFLVYGAIDLKRGVRTPIELSAGLGDALLALAQLRRTVTRRAVNPRSPYFRSSRAVLDHILSDD